MRLMRLSLMMTSGLLAMAQQPLPVEELPERTIQVTTSVVLAPVTVLTPAGNYVNGLQKQDFRLYDNEKLQAVELDVEATPISVVVAIQANNRIGNFYLTPAPGGGAYYNASEKWFIKP